MSPMHLTILAVVDVRPGATVEFGCEIEQVGGLYRSRGIAPTWGRAVRTVQEAVSDEALRVYASLQGSEEGVEDGEGGQGRPNSVSDTRH